jgi:hypothetical protein
MKRLARALAKLIFGNEGLSKRLERAAWIQALAKRLRIRELMNAGLARYPIKRQLPDSGVRYSIETFETLAVERAYFGNPIFATIFAASRPRHSSISAAIRKYFRVFWRISDAARCPAVFAWTRMKSRWNSREKT